MVIGSELTKEVASSEALILPKKSSHTMKVVVAPDSEITLKSVPHRRTSSTSGVSSMASGRSSRPRMLCLELDFSKATGKERRPVDGEE